MSGNLFRVIFDTIVAPITGTQRSAVALVRLSGPHAWDIAHRVFRAFPKSPESHRSYYGSFIHDDDGLLTLFAEGRSYTGEACAEMSIHGSPVSVRALVSACIERGARLAEPGEFTQRAFLNGKLRLDEAEAVRDLIEAETELQMRQALRLQAGRLSQECQKIRLDIARALATLDAHVDFSEELGDLDRDTLAAELRRLEAALESLIREASVSLRIRHGIRVVLLGPPNAGKSSLFNRLVGQHRAIVSDIAGTTRDYIEATVDLSGVPCTFIDTAGIRETQDQIEKEGVSRARSIEDEADLRLYLLPSDRGPQTTVGSSASVPRVPFLLVSPKSDLGPTSTGIPVSAVTGAGLQELQSAILQKLELESASELTPGNERQIKCLRNAREEIEASADLLRQDLPFDLPHTRLAEADRLLAQVSGIHVDVDSITRIFSNFCLGK